MKREDSVPMLRCCCGLRSNNASDVRPADALGEGVEPPGQTLAPGFMFCTVRLIQYQPSDRQDSSV